MGDNNAGSMTVVDGKYLHDEWCHYVIDGEACSCHVDVVRQLESDKRAFETDAILLRECFEQSDKKATQLERLLQKAEDVQEGKMEYSHTFCWWCGGLKHDMTKNAAFYCEGAALLAKEPE